MGQRLRGQWMHEFLLENNLEVQRDYVFNVDNVHVYIGSCE
jgi:hypothetical protein